MGEHASQYSVVRVHLDHQEARGERAQLGAQALTGPLPPGALHPSLPSSQTSGPAKPIELFAGLQMCFVLIYLWLLLLIISAGPETPRLHLLHHSRPNTTPSSSEKPSLTASPTLRG